MNAKFSIIFCAFLSLVFTLFVKTFAVLADTNAFIDSKPCARMLSILRADAQHGPRWMNDLVGGKLAVFNNEVADWLKPGFSSELIRRSFLRLREEGAFQIAVNDRGAMVAASSGDYSKKAWDRDHIRGFQGILASGQTEKAKKMLMASIQRLGNDSQRSRIFLSLKFPEAYKTMGHVALPQVVFNPFTLDDVEANYSWSIQKDAWGLTMHAILDGLERGLIRADELTANQKMAVVGMFALMVRTKFWEIATADAWEEENRIYSSGMGLVTGALERLKAHLYGVSANADVKNLFQEAFSGKWDAQYAESLGFIRDSLSDQRLSHAIDQGYQVLMQQISGGLEVAQFVEGKPRAADTALLWLFYYRLQRIDEALYAKLLTELESLIRPTGMLRYQTPIPDLYLNPAYFADHGEVIPSSLVRTRTHAVTGYGVRTASDTRFHVYINELFGEDYSARWSLGVIIGVQAYANMWEWFPESPNREHYKNKMKEYFVRMLAMVSPGSSVQTSGSLQPTGVSLKGERVPAYRFPEAIIPVRLYDDAGRQVEEFHAFSPYTQLNWAVAESIIAYSKMWKIFLNEAFPGLQ